MDQMSSSTSPLPENWVEELFHRMLLTYGKKFTDQWAVADTGDLIKHWCVQMAGYTPTEIKRGLAGLETRDWPPTLTEFKKMCRPPMDSMRAYYEAVEGVQARSNGEMGTWSHPAIYWAAMPLSFDLASQTYSQIKTRWEASFEAQMAIGAWEPIPAPMLALAAPGKGALSKEKAAQMVKQLGVIVKKDAKKDDPLRWARKILERAKNGDKSLMPIQVQFAKEAFNNISGEQNG